MNGVLNLKKKENQIYYIDEFISHNKNLKLNKINNETMISTLKL